DHCYYVSEDVHKVIYKRCNPEMGDVLLVNIGAGTATPALVKVDYEFSLKNVALLKPNRNKVTGEYLELYQLFNKQRLFHKLISGGAQPFLSLKQIGKLKIVLPSLPEQFAIADLLSTWDHAIEMAKQLIVTKEKQYTYLVSSLIANDESHRGHIRDFTAEVSTRNNGAAFDRVLSVTNRNGFVLPEDQFERRVASSDLSNYKTVTRGQYAYNPSRINVGSIARLDGWDTGVLSPMYVVFEIDEQKVNSDFFLHWLESHEAKERIRKSAQGSVRETVSFTDLGAISFPVPPLKQQLSIAETLNIARQGIDILKKQAEAYRKQKRGLMQKLLTGQWKVKISKGIIL
ncbi:MAG: restriction endonuclease subunit S, partial [Bacteroidetes bacterium]|nr:restriction endonuclease subunit S [Bacteroidota bacterium]